MEPFFIELTTTDEGGEKKNPNRFLLLEKLFKKGLFKKEKKKNTLQL